MPKRLNIGATIQVEIALTTITRRLGEMIDDLDQKVLSPLTPKKPKGNNGNPAFNWDQFEAETSRLLSVHGWDGIEFRRCKVLIRNWDKCSAEWLKEILVRHPGLVSRLLEQVIRGWLPADVAAHAKNAEKRIQIVSWLQDWINGPLPVMRRVRWQGLSWEHLLQADLPAALLNACVDEIGADLSLANLQVFLCHAGVPTVLAIHQQLVASAFRWRTSVANLQSGLSALREIIGKPDQFFFLRALPRQVGSDPVTNDSVLYFHVASLLRAQDRDQAFVNELLSFCDSKVFSDPREAILSQSWQRVRAIDQPGFDQFVASLTRDDLEYFFESDLFPSRPDRAKYWLDRSDEIRRTSIIYSHTTTQKIQMMMDSGRGLNQRQRFILERSFQFSSRINSTAIIAMFLDKHVVVDAIDGGACRIFDRSEFEKLIMANSLTPGAITLHSSASGDLSIGRASFKSYLDFKTKEDDRADSMIHSNHKSDSDVPPWYDEFDQELFGQRYSSLKNGRNSGRKASASVSAPSKGQHPKGPNRMKPADAQAVNRLLTYIKSEQRVGRFSLETFLTKCGIRLMPMSDGKWVRDNPEFHALAAALLEVGHEFEYHESAPRHVNSGKAAWRLKRDR